VTGDDTDGATGDDTDGAAAGDTGDADETTHDHDATKDDHDSDNEVADHTTDDGDDASNADDAPARGENPDDRPSKDDDGIDDDALVIESFGEVLPPEGQLELVACPSNSLKNVASPDTSVSSELSFTVELKNAHGGPCYVYVQTYTVPITWNQAGFNGTATPQDTFDFAKVVLGGDQAPSANVTIARPDCGPYQWDVYGGDFVETVDERGHHGLGSGVWLFRGVVVDQALCQPSHLTFMTECEALVADRGEWRFRVRNPNNVDIDFSWSKYQDEAVNGTGTALAGGDTFFTVPTDAVAIGEAIRVFTTGRDGEPKLWQTNNPGGFKDLAECGLALDIAKIVCDDYANVPQNAGGDNPPLGIGNVDLTDGGYAASQVSWNTTGGWLDVDDEIAAAKARGCHLAEWTFEFYDNGGSLLDSVASSADGVVSYPLEGDVLAAALAGTLHVAESFDNLIVDTASVPPYFTGGPQDGDYRFGSLRCAQDGANIDNRETIRLANVRFGDPIGCVAYNVPVPADDPTPVTPVIPSTPTTEVEESVVEPDAVLDDVCVDDATAVEEADDCSTDEEIDVLPEAGEEAEAGEEPDPTTDPAPETDRTVQVGGVSQEVTATRAALPMTGASALLLSVLGLLGLGFGGALVRPRKRD
jgi:LPXTG-motif cell wall-anchored protein